MPTAARTKAAARFDSLEQEVFLNLWRTYDRLRGLEDALFARFDFTPQQYNVLRLLRTQHPGSVPTLWLAERLVSALLDITRMLDKLEQRGLIARRRPDDNRRTVLIEVTPPGVAMLDRIALPLRKCHEQQLGHLPAKDLKQLARMLRAARAPHEPPESSWS